MPGRTTSFLSDKLVKAASLLFVTTMMTNVFSYAFQLAMGRLLLSPEYGLLNALLALFVVLSVPVSTLLMLVARRASQHKAAGDYGAIRALFGSINGTILAAGSIGLAVFIVTSPWTRDYVKAPSVVPVVLLGIAAFTALPVPINTAVLQGVQDYRWLAINSGVAGPVKFALCLVPAALGLGVNGVLTALILTNAVLWTLSFIPLRRYFRLADRVSSRSTISFREVLPVFVANLSFAFLAQIDMVWVARYFQPETTGLYAYAATLGKAVMYVPGAIVMAMFPMVSERSALQGGTRGLLIKSAAATLLFSGAGAAVLYAFPLPVLTLTFGLRAAGAAGLLPVYALAMLPMALLIILMNYLIARGKTRFGYLMALAAAAEVGMIRIWHATPLQILGVVAFCSTALIAGGIGLELLAAPQRNEKKENDPGNLVQDVHLSSIGS